MCSSSLEASKGLPQGQVGAGLKKSRLIAFTVDPLPLPQPLPAAGPLQASLFIPLFFFFSSPLSSSSLPFFSPWTPPSVNKSPFEAYIQRGRPLERPLPSCFGRKSPDVSLGSFAETRRHKSIAADLCALALLPSPARPPATSAPWRTPAELGCAAPAPPGRRYESEPGALSFGHVGGGQAEVDGGPTLGGSRSGIGRRGISSRLIGMRLPGPSRVTRWGLFLRRGGGSRLATSCPWPNTTLVALVMSQGRFFFQNSARSWACTRAQGSALHGG